MAAGAGCWGAAGISEAVLAPDGTATPDWVLLVATSDGEGCGEAGSTTACCCCGWVVDWLESALRRVAAALPESALADSLLLVSVLATCFLAMQADLTGAGVFSAGVMAAAGAGASAADGVVASGVIAAGTGCGAGGAGGRLLAVTTGLGWLPEWA